MSRYDSLKDRLSMLQGSGRVSFSFLEIEQLIGGALPAAAKRPRAWWANETDPKASHVQCCAWMNAGWLVDDVDTSVG